MGARAGRKLQSEELGYGMVQMGTYEAQLAGSSSFPPNTIGGKRQCNDV